MIAACEKAGTKLALAFVNRHSAAYGAARDLIEEGRIGQVLELRARGKEDRRGGGEDLWVLGCHVLDLMVDLGGAPKWCQATVTLDGRPITKADAVEGPEGLGLIAGDAIAAMFGLADGPVGYLPASARPGSSSPPSGSPWSAARARFISAPTTCPRPTSARPRSGGPTGTFPGSRSARRGSRRRPPRPATNEERAADRAGWGRRAAADLLDAIVNDREPETGMYAGRTRRGDERGGLRLGAVGRAGDVAADRATQPAGVTRRLRARSS